MQVQRGENIDKVYWFSPCLTKIRFAHKKCQKIHSGSSIIYIRPIVIVFLKVKRSETIFCKKKIFLAQRARLNLLIFCKQPAKQVKYFFMFIAEVNDLWVTALILSLFIADARIA